MVTNNAINSSYPVVYGPSTAVVNTRNTGTTILLRTDPNCTFFLPNGIIGVCTNGPITVGNACQFSIGTNAASYDNIAPNGSLFQLDFSTSTIQDASISSMALVAWAAVPPNTDIYINITAAATAVTADMRFILYGINIY